MSKFEPGQRVSFLYFGERVRGTIVKPISGLHNFQNWIIEKDGGANVCVGVESMRKLKPRKPRREFWVAVETRYPNASFKAFPDKDEAQDYIENSTDKVGWEIVHVKEVKS